MSAALLAGLDRARRLLDAPAPEPLPGQLAVEDGPRIGSLCTGYGGLDEAVRDVLGGSLAWVADLDPGPRKILAHHWPDVPNLGDLTAVDWSAVEPVDVLTAGYPCQPFSVAGRRKGTADERHIWPYIAAAIRVLRPRLCLFENVAGHVRLGLADVLADLAALGFDAEWTTVRASDVGAPHQRERLFILARPADADRRGLPQLPERHREPDRAETDNERRKPHLVGCGAPDADADGDAVRPEPLGEPRRGRAAVARRVGTGTHADTARERLERGGWHGDGGPDLRTAVAELPADADREPGQQRRQPAPGEAPSGRASTVDCGCNRAPWGKYAPAIHRWEQVTGRPAPAPVNDRGRLAPVFVEWLMGLTAGHVTDVPELSRTQQLKALGNGVVPQQAGGVLRYLLARVEAAV